MEENNDKKLREWVKPNFECQDLKDALAGGTVPSGDAGAYS